MKTIKIWADIHSTGIFDEKGKFFLQNETSISKETWKELQQWVNDYDDIAILGESERQSRLKEISALDDRGMKLRDKISREWTFDDNDNQVLNIIYFSEGLYKVLHC